MRFIRWIPVDDLKERTYLKALYDDNEGLRLLLMEEGGGRVLEVSFDYRISYSNSDEGDLLKTLNTIAKEDLGWPFLKVQDSDFIKRYLDQRYEEKSHMNIVHYGIYTENDCVDVLSAVEPTVEWLNE